MVARKATDEQILTAVREGGSYLAASRLIDMAESSVRERAKRLLAGRDDGAALAEKGLLGTEPVLPGYVLKRSTAVYDKEGDLSRQYVTQAKAPGRVAEIPAGHVVKGYSILKDAEGRITQEWMKTREGTDPLAVVAAIKAAFEGYQSRHVPIPAPAAASEDLLTLLPLADWHVGAHAWARETATSS